MAFDVLVVENSEDWRARLVGLLVDEGKYKISEATDYESASEMLQKQTFDVIVLEIRLVDWDETNEEGMDLLRKLGPPLKRKGTQALIVSAYLTPGLVKEAFKDLGVADCLEKQPFFDSSFPEEFKAAVLKAAENARRARQAVE